MVSPWSTNATEIARNVGLTSVTRIEEFRKATSQIDAFDKMLEARYSSITDQIFEARRQANPPTIVDDIAAFNELMGLALSAEEIAFLEQGARTWPQINRLEVFAFGQINSEHCRHKIFNGQFVIDGETQPKSLFAGLRTRRNMHQRDGFGILEQRRVHQRSKN